MPSKYAPNNEAGEKAYVVTVSDWGKERTYVVYSDKPSNATYQAVGRKRVGVYVTGVRRALVAECGNRA